MNIDFYLNQNFDEKFYAAKGSYLCFPDMSSATDAPTFTFIQKLSFMQSPFAATAKKSAVQFMLKSFVILIMVTAGFAGTVSAQSTKPGTTTTGVVTVKPVLNADKTWGLAVLLDQKEMYAAAIPFGGESGFPTEKMATEKAAILLAGIKLQPSAITALSKEKIKELYIAGAKAGNTTPAKL